MTRRDDDQAADQAHRRLRELLGSYALGHLPRTQTAAVRAHLDGCAECRAELAEIAPLGDDLRGIDPERLSAIVTPPPDLGERIRGAVAHERGLRDRRARSSRLLAAAAAVVAVLAVGAVGFAVGDRREVGPPQPFEAVAVETGAGVVADAGVVPHTWGVEIKLVATGFVPGESYAVTVRTEDGRERSAGAFVGTGARELRCNLNSDVLRSDAAGFTVVDASGAVVLSADLPAA
jgi:anti-sigma factor RsiW